jgi:predicted GNAT family acetyltransferase
VRFEFTHDPQEFVAWARPFLERHLECNVMATVTQSVLDGFYHSSEPVFAYGLDDSNQVCFGALRTPPSFMLASELDPADAPALIDSWLDVDPDVPGVSSLRDTARAIGAAWASSTGGETSCRMQEGLHRLVELTDPPRPAPGNLRLPQEGEIDLLMDWTDRFAVETGTEGGDRVEMMVRARLANDALMLWEDGVPVCMVGMAGPAAGVARLGPVYTPPDRRGRGYAATAVAAFSRHALARGVRTCILYTDLANTTSNRIYASVGYRRFADWEERAFTR